MIIISLKVFVKEARISSYSELTYRLFSEDYRAAFILIIPKNDRQRHHV